VKKVVIVHNPLNGMVLCVKGSSGGQGVFPVFDKSEIVLVILGKFRATGYVLVPELAKTIFANPDVQYISCQVSAKVQPRADAAFELELKAPQDVLKLLGDDTPEQVKKYIQDLVRPWQKKTA